MTTHPQAMASGAGKPNKSSTIREQGNRIFAPVNPEIFIQRNLGKKTKADLTDSHQKVLPSTALRTKNPRLFSSGGLATKKRVDSAFTF
jgi:hypothetical protein